MIMIFFSFLLLIYLSLIVHIAAYSCASDDGYSMYVWTQGFNATADFCSGIYPISKTGSYATCWYHNWESPAARQRLWASTNIPGRKVTRIYLSDVKKRIENNGMTLSSSTCDTDLISFLSGAHQRGIKVYALFAVSNEAFSETYMAEYPHQFNTACGTDMAYFDGVSVNNEYFSQVRECISENQVAQLKFLDDLNTTAHNSKPLPLHFSVSWNWDCCDCSLSSYVPLNLNWGSETKTALAHMIDISDSVDVQVAYNVPDVMERRGIPPHNYFIAKPDKSTTARLYILAYASPNSLCQLSFSPHKKGSTTVTDTCSKGNRTQAGMFAAFDYVENALPGAIGGIHYMGGVFSTGMTTDWPKHNSKYKTCPLNKKYHWKKKKCVQKCKKGTVWDWSMCRCKCPKDCKRKKKGSKRCQPRCSNNNKKWDPNAKSCIPIDSETLGFIWSGSTKECILV